jgi:hypothetical protein
MEDPVTCTRLRSFFAALALTVSSAISAFAQVPEGPQASAPAPVAPVSRPALERRTVAGSGDKVTVPAGTRVAVVLENGISTRSAKAGDSLYFRTSFPITQNNRVIVPSVRISAASCSNPSAPVT